MAIKPWYGFPFLRLNLCINLPNFKVKSISIYHEHQNKFLLIAISRNKLIRVNIIHFIHKNIQTYKIKLRRLLKLKLWLNFFYSMMDIPFLDYAWPSRRNISFSCLLKVWYDADYLSKTIKAQLWFAPFLGMMFHK